MQLRRFLAAFWIALALVVGQQAAALHDLSHASEQLAQNNKGKPAHHSCDQCFLSAQLSGAVGTTILALPVVPMPLAVSSRVDDRFVPGAPRVPFRSRAPPALA